VGLGTTNAVLLFASLAAWAPAAEANYALALGPLETALCQRVKLASSEAIFMSVANVMASGLQLLFGKFAKLIGNGAGRSQRD
jgi:hypothetical protein